MPTTLREMRQYQIYSLRLVFCNLFILTLFRLEVVLIAYLRTTMIMFFFISFKTFAHYLFEYWQGVRLYVFSKSTLANVCKFESKIGCASQFLSELSFFSGVWGSPQGALRRPVQQAVLRRPLQVHVQRASRADGLGRFERRQDRTSHVGRDQPKGFRTWNHSWRFLRPGEILFLC